MGEQIFGPVLGLMSLTVAVWVFMFARRIPFINSLDIESNALTSAELTSRSPVSVSNPSDNLKNLFEMPVLFYALCGYLFVTNTVDAVYVWCAWGFLAFRILHSIVHCLTMQVMLRFLLYLISCLCLFAMLTRASISYFL